MAVPEHFVKVTPELIKALDGTTLRVVLQLATYADYSTGKNAWPSIETLMTDLGIKSRNTVKSALRTAERKGFLRRHARNDANGGETSAHYDCLWISGSCQNIDRGVANTLAGDRAENCPQPRALDRNPLTQISTHTRQTISGNQNRLRQQAERLVQLYHAFAPNAARYTLPTDYMPPQIAKAIAMNRTEQQWIKYFRKVQESDKLAPPMDGYGYATDLIFVLTPANMAKIEADAYSNDKEPE